MHKYKICDFTEIDYKTLKLELTIIECADISKRNKCAEFKIDKSNDNKDILICLKTRKIVPNILNFKLKLYRYIGLV